MKTIGLIGTGHMGSAIIRAADRTEQELSFVLSDVRADAAKKLAGSLKHPAEAVSNEAVIENADLVFLAVKPQNMREMLSTLRPAFRLRKEKEEGCPLTIVTMAAGVTVESILSDIGMAFPVIRIMPNTPIDVLKGVIGYYEHEVPKTASLFFQTLLSDAALLTPVEEDRLDAVCALSGCGPAFVYLMIRGMAEAGEKLGLDPDEALKLSAKTVEGAASMVLEGMGSPTELKDAVSSPGGATVEGVKVLEGQGFEALLEQAIEASYKRTLELK